MNKKKIGLKTAALITAFGLIAGILFITNSFVGNPISAAFAHKAITEYVEQKYATLDLEVEKAHYNFKDGGYMARAKSQTSIDTQFAIYYRAGKVLRDDYEIYVLGKYNTLSRLEEECSTLIIPVLSNISELNHDRSRVQIEKWEYEKANQDIQLDMKYDKTLPLDLKITLRPNLTENSLGHMANIFEKSHRTLLDNGYIFTSYHMYAEYDGVSATILYVTPADIESGELEKLLEDGKNYVDTDTDVDKNRGKGDDRPEPIERLFVHIKDGKEVK